VLKGGLISELFQNQAFDFSGLQSGDYVAK